MLPHVETSLPTESQTFSEATAQCIKIFTSQITSAIYLFASSSERVGKQAIQNAIRFPPYNAADPRLAFRVC
jgi:hypothetical protein